MSVSIISKKKGESTGIFLMMAEENYVFIFLLYINLLAIIFSSLF